MTFLRQHRKTVVDKIAYWTGVQRPLARKLIEVIEKRSAELGLLADTKREAEHLTEIYRLRFCLGYQLYDAREVYSAMISFREMPQDFFACARFFRRRRP